MGSGQDTQPTVNNQGQPSIAGLLNKFLVPGIDPGVIKKNLGLMAVNPNQWWQQNLEKMNTPEAQAFAALDPMLGLTLKSGFVPSKNALYIDWVKTDSPLEGRRAINEILKQVKDTGATKIMFHPETINEVAGSKRSMLDIAKILDAVKIPNENTMMLHPLDLSKMTRGMDHNEWQRLYANYGINYLPEKYNYIKYPKGY